MAHRIRWTAVWVLLGLWLAGLILDFGGGAVNLLLVLGLAVLVYELLAVDRAA